MKKIMIYTTILFVLMGMVFAYYSHFPEDDTMFVVQEMKYEPEPVSPGEYFDLWMKVENYGGVAMEDFIFELEPEYPFYFDLKSLKSMITAFDEVTSIGKETNRINIGINRVKYFSWEQTAQQTLEVYRSL